MRCQTQRGHPRPRRVGAQGANSASGWQCDLGSDSRALAQEGTWVRVARLCLPSSGAGGPVEAGGGTCAWGLSSQRFLFPPESGITPERLFLSPKDPRACCPPPSALCPPGPARRPGMTADSVPEWLALNGAALSFAWLLPKSPASPGKWGPGGTCVLNLLAMPTITGWRGGGRGGSAGQENPGPLKKGQLGQGVHPACLERREQGVGLGHHPHLTPRTRAPPSGSVTTARPRGRADPQI